MSSQVEQIKERLGIVDVVSQYIKLEKAGSNFRSRCPFHNEKTPSFFVSPTRNSYYCFGCNVKGDIFSFVEEFEGVDFIGALKSLGEKAGVDIVFESAGVKDERTQLFSIMAAASLFFENNLKKETKVVEYLKERGLTEETIQSWNIGYAPDSWSALYDELKKTYRAEEIEKAGLIKKTEKDGRYYDRFRSRILFPIFDNTGRVVAFSGRIFEGDDEKHAKYINSPETPLFSKSKILYGYDKAKFSIRKLNFSIVVEGQMDLLASHQAGFTNTVALSGTALTVEQISLLQRLSNNVVLALDSDSAGVASSGKSAILMLTSGMDVKVAHLKVGDDPAEVLQRDKDEWKQAIKNSQHIIDFHLNVLCQSINDKRKLRLEARRLVIPYIARIPNKIDQAHFISTTAHKLGVPEDDIREEVSKVNVEGFFNIKQETVITRSTLPVIKNKRDSIESDLIGIVLWQKGVKNPIIDIKIVIKELEDIFNKEVVSQLIEKYNTDELLFKVENTYNNTEELRGCVTDLLYNLKQECIKEELATIVNELISAESEGNQEKIAKILKRHKELTSQLNT